ncbi:unnamed protein product [Somion occarium]|uniref:Transcription factor IIIC 90kDa subunit N-terminal domain-containing protein n=1 Tax=Somion occarium TaxID=3059160 RepID=A0ABP1E5G2_9APHY
MNEPFIRSAIPLPGVAPFPSANVLQWTDDGQVVVVTTKNIYILSPSSGTQADTSSFVKQSLPDGTLVERQGILHWLRTVIEWDAVGELRQWPIACQEWAAVSLGSLDPCFRSVTCSPSNISVHASCVLAVLTSNLQVSLWCPAKNMLTGKWTKIEDFTDVHYYPSDAANQALFRTLQEQITSISWSLQTDFLVSPMPVVDGSLLAIGSRAGILSFVRLIRNTAAESTLRHVTSVPVSDRWIIQLAWSPWKSSCPGQCQAYVACGDPAGSIKIVEVSQVLQQNPSPFSADFGIAIECKLLDVAPSSVDGKAMTSMKWVQAHGDIPYLVFGTPGELHIWPSKPDSELTGARALALRTQRISVGSSCFAPLSGFAYNHRHDTLVASLADGSFHVVKNLSKDPALASPADEIGLTTEAMTAMVRSAFNKVEGGDALRRTDVNRVDGMTTYDGESTYTWIHEHTRPTDFDYKHDAKHTSTLIVAELWPGSTDDFVLTELVRIITNTRASTGEAPIGLLRAVWLHLQDPERVSRLRDQIVQILHQPELPDPGTALVLPAWAGELSSQVRDEFVRSLRTHLFGWDNLHRLRVKFYIAMFCKARVVPEVQNQFDGIMASVTTILRFHVLFVLMRHITAMPVHISENEVPFVLRIVAQGLEMSDLATAVQEVFVTLNGRLPSQNLDVLSADELCPACHAPVPFNDINTAVCANGHSWQRCSITSFILSTPMVRTCLGCRRKAFMPRPRAATSPNWLPIPARSWLVEDLLEAVRRCLYCGNNFVTLV